MPKNFIGTVSPLNEDDPKTYLSNLQQLDEVVRIYKIDEIVFCSQDISSQSIMRWMTHLGNEIIYKIVPVESLNIIGSSSKNSRGELYTIDIQFNIATKMSRRNKRFLDIVVAIVLLLVVPLLLFIVEKKGNFIKNIFRVLIAEKTWVGYALVQDSIANLPQLKNSVLSPLTALQLRQANQPTIERLNFLYAKDYDTARDLEIIWQSIRHLGN